MGIYNINGVKYICQCCMTTITINHDVSSAKMKGLDKNKMCSNLDPDIKILILSVYVCHQTKENNEFLKRHKNSKEYVTFSYDIIFFVFLFFK